MQLTCIRESFKWFHHVLRMIPPYTNDPYRVSMMSFPQGAMHESSSNSLDLCQSDDDLSFCMPFCHITERVWNLRERILSIDHRFDLACFTKLCDGDKIFIVLGNCEKAYVPACGLLNPWSQKQDLEQCRDRASNEEIRTIGLECPPIGEGRAMRDHIQNEVILFSSLGEVLAGVVDHMVGAEGTQKLQLACVIHRGHLRPV